MIGFKDDELKKMANCDDLMRMEIRSILFKVENFFKDQWDDVELEATIFIDFTDEQRARIKEFKDWKSFREKCDEYNAVKEI